MEALSETQEKYFYRLFRLGIFLKGLISLVEIFAGVTILFVAPADIGNAIITVSQNELAEDPASFFALHALPLAQQFSLTPQIFLAVYLLSRGLIKIALVVALLRNKLWAYPAALAVLGLFMLYQIYQIFVGHSTFLIMLTLFDLIVMYLIWHEYRLVKKHRGPAVRDSVVV